MLTLPEDLSDTQLRLVGRLATTCVTLPDLSPLDQARMYSWLDSTLGEARPGNIIQEALNGWLDFYDGDWQIIMNPFAWDENLLIWFARKEDLAEFTLTWT